MFNVMSFKQETLHLSAAKLLKLLQKTLKLTGQALRGRVISIPYGSSECQQ